MLARLIPLGCTVVAASLISGAALAQPAAAPLAPSPDPGPDVSVAGAARRPLQRVLGWIAWLADVQRSGDPDLRASPPRVTGGAAPGWLPDVRTSVPPRGEAVNAHPPRWIGVPMLIEPANTQVAGDRGGDGMLLGIQITLPWRIP